MILAINTSSEEIVLMVLPALDTLSLEGGNPAIFTRTWPADRTLSDILLPEIMQALKDLSLEPGDLTGLILYQGPGGYTALRIAASILNTLADQLKVPIVGVSGESWLSSGITKLKAGKDDKIVLPVYSSPPKITKPKK